MSNICAVVVTYNRKELLKECITALLSQSTLVDVMIIDNASTDGTEQELETWKSKGQIQYYNTGSNLGGAGGFHYGIKKAMMGSYEYLWIMDDDTIPRVDTAEQLNKAAAMLDNQFGFLNSTVFFNDKELCEMNRPGISSEWYDMKKYHYIQNGLINVRYASFVSLFLRTEVVKRVGLPIKEFFIWNDDYEYTTRISKLYDNYMVCASVVHHKMKTNQSTNILTEESDRISRYYFNYRNGFYVAKRDGKKAVAKHFLTIMELLCKIIFGKTRYKGKKCWIVLKGTLAGIGFCPKVEYIGN